MRLSVVVDTYEWPEALHAVLLGLSDQSDRNFDVVVADDGSGAETAALVEGWKEFLPLTHVRQDDDGYRLARVRNLGALAAAGDYLVFVNSDTVPRRHFVRAVRDAAVPGWFLAGKRLLLSQQLTRRVLADQIPVQRWSLPHWALHSGEAQPLSALTPRDRRRPGREGLPEFVPHADGYGFLLGVSRADFERVNGYDARFAGWGGEDVDMAVRLRRAGLRCGWAGPQSTLLHLWHETRKPAERPNDALLRETESGDYTAARDGLRELADAR
jgi:GT2 family glycosyltransferase